MKSIHLFSGGGGDTEGFLRSPSANPILAIDNDRFCSAVYRSRFPQVECVLDNVQDMKNFPMADIVIGGSPCPDFSLVNLNRAGLKGSSGSLFWQYLRVLSLVSPEFFIFENVKGIKKYLPDIFLAFQELGYQTIVRYSDGVKFVPQKRQRVFILGSKSGFYKGSSAYRELPPRKLQDIIGYGNVIQHSAFKETRIYDEYCPTLTKSIRQAIKILTPGGDLNPLTANHREALMGWAKNSTSYGVVDGRECLMSQSRRMAMLGNGIIPSEIEFMVKTFFLH